MGKMNSEKKYGLCDVKCQPDGTVYRDLRFLVEIIWSRHLTPSHEIGPPIRPCPRQRPGQIAYFSEKIYKLLLFPSFTNFMKKEGV